MRLRASLVSAAVLYGSLGIASGVVGATTTPAATPPVTGTFTISGTISAISVPKNTLTVLVKKKRYAVVVSTTTTYTMQSKRTTLKKMKVGERVRVTGRQLGTLYLGLTVRG